MPIPVTYSFIRYLAAKKSVDDRALNQHVWQRVVAALPPATPETPLRVLEVGAGIGTMVERLVDWGVLSAAIYTAVDSEASTIAEARLRLPRWGQARGLRVRAESETRLRLQDTARELVVETEASDLFSFIERERQYRTWDLLIAHTLLDLLDVPAALPLFCSALRPGGLLYCSTTFDGATILQPEIDPILEAQIEALYHATMDQRTVAGKPAGDSRTGRHLFDHLRAAGMEVLDAGSSDWVVFAGATGYPADEAYFLHFILHTIRTALAGHPDLDAGRFAAWIEQRHAQVEQGTLVYIAHQLDVLGRLPALPPQDA